MTYQKALAFLATLSLAVAFVIVVFVSGADRKTVEGFALFGLACLAGAHT